MKFSDHAKKYGNIKGKGWINIYSNAVKRENFWVNIKELNGKQYTWKKNVWNTITGKRKVLLLYQDHTIINKKWWENW